MKFATMTCWIAALGVAAPVIAQEMPHRKPGLWESTMTSSQAPARNVTSQQCIDQSTDAEMLKRATGNQEGGNAGSCTRQTTKRLSNGVEIDSECKQGNAVITSNIRMTGDFNSQYTMEMKGRRTPPAMGTGDFQSTVVAKHMGACPSDMKPGDMKINGMLIKAGGVPANLSPAQAEQMRQIMEQAKKIAK